MAELESLCCGFPPRIDLDRVFGPEPEHPIGKAPVCTLCGQLTALAVLDGAPLCGECFSAVSRKWDWKGHENEDTDFWSDENLGFMFLLGVLGSALVGVAVIGAGVTAGIAWLVKR